MTQHRMHGPWKIMSSRDVYTDPWLRLQRDEVIQPDGNPGSYIVAHLRRGVTVVALDDAGQVHLTKEFHYAIGRTTIELVSGGIDDGEAPFVAAQRELAEELGLSAASWIGLGVTNPFTANVLSPTTMYLARQLSHGESEPEGTEQIEHVTMPLAEAVEMAYSGEISHAPSAIALLKTQALLDGKFKGFAVED